MVSVPPLNLNNIALIPPGAPLLQSSRTTPSFQMHLPSLELPPAVSNPPNTVANRINNAVSINRQNEEKKNINEEIDEEKININEEIIVKVVTATLNPLRIHVAQKK